MRYKPLAKILSIIFCTLVLLYMLGLFQNTIKYPYGDMDWNHDGKTSFSELLDATDIGRQELQIGEDKCTRYFAYKDGQTIKVICPNNKELESTLR